MAEADIFRQAILTDEWVLVIFQTANFMWAARVAQPIVIRLKMENREIGVLFPAETRGFSFLFFFQNAQTGCGDSIPGGGEAAGM